MSKKEGEQRGRVFRFHYAIWPKSKDLYLLEVHTQNSVLLTINNVLVWLCCLGVLCLECLYIDITRVTLVHFLVLLLN